MNLKWFDDLTSILIEISSGGKPLRKDPNVNYWHKSEKDAEILKRKIHEELLLDFCREQSQSVIYVITQLTFEDQVKIESFLNNQSIQNVIVIHNYLKF